MTSSFFWKKKSSKTSAQKDEAAISEKLASTSMTSKERPFHSVGNATQKGYIAFNPGKVNQDRFVCLVDFGGNPSHAIFAVFDGHGANGHEVSEFVSRTLPLNLTTLSADCDVPECMQAGFMKTAKSLEKTKRINSVFSGTTAILTFLTPYDIYTANAGDSRAVLGRVIEDSRVVAINLSEDHKPEREDEKARITQNQGRIQSCQGALGEAIGPPRVWLPFQDVPGLAMTRSFGDTIAKSIGVNAIPEVSRTPRRMKDRYLIVASDGIWEFISSQEAVEIVHRCSSASEACLALQKESVKRWKMEENVVDDITAVVVYL